jgi:hypothetical protein
VLRISLLNKVPLRMRILGIYNRNQFSIVYVGLVLFHVNPSHTSDSIFSLILRHLSGMSALDM